MLWAVIALAVTPAAASNITFTGTFLTDDQLEIFTFVPTGTNVVIQTHSYGDGSNGFDPVLSLYGPGLSLLASTPLLIINDNGGASVPADPIGGEHFDAFIDTLPSLVPLTAGAQYFLVLSESPSSPLGNAYGDGFSGTGQGNYTGGIYGCGAGPFCDIDVNQRNGGWAVDFLGVTSATDLSQDSAVPEPSSIALVGGALLALALRRKRNATVLRHRL